MHAVLLPNPSRPRMDRDGLYREVTERFGAALRRLAGGYEAEPERRKDLLQDIHAAVWRSLELYDGKCSRRTWGYRVAHNVATSHLIRHAGVRRESFLRRGIQNTMRANIELLKALTNVCTKRAIESFDRAQTCDELERVRDFAVDGDGYREKVDESLIEEGCAP
jgi:DNA-directed RNA polymerase specialized sigma24 family protein